VIRHRSYLERRLRIKIVQPGALDGAIGIDGLHSGVTDAVLLQRQSVIEPTPTDRCGRKRSHERFGSVYVEEAKKSVGW